MARRKLSDTGLYHITTRSAGQVALFEDDDDRRYYLRLIRQARNLVKARVIAWVLMTDHVHLVVDFGEEAQNISVFMHYVDARYTRYFNSKTKRSGTLFQGVFWSKPICSDEQLVATVHYIHMNPEAVGLAPMRSYRWSSYQEYAGKHWVVDTTLVLGVFGGFKAFDAYGGSPKDVVSQRRLHIGRNRDNEALEFALEQAGVSTSSELRALPRDQRNAVMRQLSGEGYTLREIARVFGIGPATVMRALR